MVLTKHPHCFTQGPANGKLPPPIQIRKFLARSNERVHNCSIKYTLTLYYSKMLLFGFVLCPLTLTLDCLLACLLARLRCFLRAVSPIFVYTTVSIQIEASVFFFTFFVFVCVASRIIFTVFMYVYSSIWWMNKLPLENTTSKWAYQQTSEWTSVYDAREKKSNQKKKHKLKQNILMLQ